MKHIGKIIGIIILIIIISLFAYAYNDSAPCRIAPPPPKFIIGSRIVEDTYPNGTWWVSNGKTTYTGYVIDSIPFPSDCGGLIACHYAPRTGYFPNGTEYGYIVLWINPNIPKWCNS